MRNDINCSFKTKENFEEFCATTGFDLTPNVKEYNVLTGEKKFRRTVKKKPEKEQYWETQWFGMPEYVSKKRELYAFIKFIFPVEDLELARKIFQQNITDRTDSIWFPHKPLGDHAKLRITGGDGRLPKYPFYVISKGRYDRCYTSRYLSQMEVYHYVVCEPDEYELYLQNENQYCKVLQLDMKYKEEYDVFDENLGQKGVTGPGAARNFCWDDSIRKGYKCHWVFDDNAIGGFYYMWHNWKVKCRLAEFFTPMEDFMDRYENLAILGLNYEAFCAENSKLPAFVMNTRIYSFLLIRNDIPYRWRGRYNEDTDLSLRVLKDGWCTVQFNAFMAKKAWTQTVKGGNTAVFYEKEGTYAKSKMLEEMHPDVAKVVWKFNRWHHQVDYSGFTQKLVLKDGMELPKQKIDNYGMVIFNTTLDNTYDTKKYLYENYYDEITNGDFTHIGGAI